MQCLSPKPFNLFRTTAVSTAVNVPSGLKPDCFESEMSSELSKTDVIQLSLGDNKQSKHNTIDTNNQLAIGDSDKQLATVENNKQLATGDHDKHLADADNNKQHDTVGNNKQLSTGDKDKQLVAADNYKQLATGDKDKQLLAGDNSKQHSTVANDKQLTRAAGAPEIDLTATTSPQKLRLR